MFLSPPEETQMKRSRINTAVKEATAAFEERHWALPPDPRWDVTDFGLGDFDKAGLVLVNLTEQREYCEKIMFAKRGQRTPMHHHGSKKEDIVCRWGKLAVKFKGETDTVRALVNGEERKIPTAASLLLTAGERVTLFPGTDHEFWPESDYAIIGEVSTLNDDASDNTFENPDIGRFSEIDEDESALVKLVSD